MDVLTGYTVLSLVVFVYMTMWFLVSLVLKRNDVADVAWGLGFFVIASVLFFYEQQWTLRSLIVMAAVTIWSWRLAIHIYLRNRKKTEDKRYKKWRDEWGKWFIPRSYGQVFLLQGLLMLIISAPVITSLTFPTVSFDSIAWIGVALWGIGFFFEAVGDWQLSSFLNQQKNKGKLMTEGLWRYTRHPNYFGEVTQWWGIWLMALSAPFGWWAIIGPVTITVLILFVSGIPMTERGMSSHPDFAEYKKRTSMFIPWFPKRNYEND